MLSRRGFLGAVLAGAMLDIPNHEALGAARTSLAQAARAGGRAFGAAARIDLIESDAELRSAILQECSTLTPEFHMNWNHFQPTEDEFRFGPVDGLAGFAAANGLAFRGHTLVWDESIPAWAQDRLVAGDWTPVRRYFEALVPRYPTATEWEVVNEPIDTQTGHNGYRLNSYYRGFGPDYVRRALLEARRLAPGARLMINDYSLEYDNPVDEDRRRMYLRLAESLRRDGLIDAAGIQAHLDLSKGILKTDRLRAFFSALADLGLTIVVTELDVKEADLTAPVHRRDQRVADEAQRFLDVALAEPAVTGVVTWGLSDRHSWLHDQSKGLPAPEMAAKINRGLPYDAHLVKKPMYWSMRDSFLRQRSA